MLDFSTVMKDAREVSRQFGISQKDVMIGMSNLAGVLPNNNGQWKQFIALSKFAAEHHPNYGDMSTQMMNLSNAIATGNTRMIRHIAGNIQLSKVYEDFARKSNKTVGALTQQERATATLEALIHRVGDATDFASQRFNVQVNILNQLSRIWTSIGRIVYPLWAAMKKMISAVLEPIAQALEDVADASGDVDNVLGNLTKKTDLAKKPWWNLARAIADLAEAIAIILGWIIKLAVKLIILPLAALSKLFMIAGAAAGIFGLALQALFIVIGKAFAIGSLLVMVDILKNLVVAFSSAGAGAKTFGDAIKAGVGKAGTATGTIQRLKDFVSGFGAVAKETGAARKGGAILEAIVPKAAYTGTEMAISGSMEAAKGGKALTRPVVGVITKIAQAIKGKIPIGDIFKGVEGGGGSLKVMGNILRSVAGIAESYIGKVGETLTRYSGWMTKATEGTGLFGRAIGGISGLLGRFGNFFSGIGTGIGDFVTSLTRGNKAYMSFFEGMGVQVGGKATRFGGWLSKVISGTDLFGNKIGRLTTFFGGLLGKLGSVGGWLAKIGKWGGARGLPILSIAIDMITIGRAVNAYAQMRATQKEMKKMEEERLKIVNKNYQNALNSNRKLGDEVSKSYEQEGEEGLEIISERLKKERQAITERENLNISAKKGEKVSFEGSEAWQRNMAQQKQLNAIIEKVRASKGKNKFATEEVLKVDKEMYSTAKGIYGQVDGLIKKRDEMQKAGQVDSAQWKENEEQIQAVADSLGIGKNKMLALRDETEFTNVAIKELWKIKGTDLLKGLDQQIRQAAEAVDSLKIKILDSKAAVESFILSWRAAAKGSSPVEKTTADIDLLIKQFDRMKAAGVGPAKLAEQTQKIMEGVQGVGGAKYEEWQLGPAGQAWQMQQAAMQRANPAAAAAAERQKRAEFIRESQEQYGGAGLEEQFMMYSEQAAKKDQEELARARELLRDIETTAGMFAEAIKAAGGNLDQVRKELELFPTVIEKMNEKMAEFQGLTGKAAEDLQKGIKGLIGTEGVAPVTTSGAAVTEGQAGLNIAGQAKFSPETNLQIAEARLSKKREVGDINSMVGGSSMEAIIWKSRQPEAEDYYKEETSWSRKREIRKTWEERWKQELDTLEKQVKTYKDILEEEKKKKEGKAFGGRIGGMPGTDRVPIWATRDEVVIRPEVSRAWMGQLLEFNRTGDPSVFFKSGMKRGGRVSTSSFQFGGVVGPSAMDRILSQSHIMLGNINTKLDVLSLINTNILGLIDRFDAFAKGLNITVNIPDKKISFDPLSVRLTMDDMGRFVTREQVLDLIPKTRTEGYGNMQ